MDLTDSSIKTLVYEFPGQTVYQLLELFAANGGPDVSKPLLNSKLYKLHRKGELEWKQGPRYSRMWYPQGESWTLVDDDLVVKLALYPWQKDALRWWNSNHEKGVVEAVTGAGKTRLALAVAAKQIGRGGQTVVVVPSKELLFQWANQFEQMVGDKVGLSFTLGYLGNGHNDIWKAPDVLLATVQSGYRQPRLTHREQALIIADEVHHYGSEEWKKVLKPEFTRRLGLTATFEREDNGIDEHLGPYFQQAVFPVGYERALADDVIAHFKIAFVGARFSDEEQSDYDTYNDKELRYRRKLINDFGLPEEPWGEFIQEVQRLNKGGFGEATGIARGYLDAFSKRRQVLASAVHKLGLLEELAPAISAAEKAILFTQTQAAAEEAIELLEDVGINGAVLTSKMDMSERKEVFAGFERGDHELVAAPRLLDEGVDVPSADLAIVLASSRTKRQMIQRMGRIVRKKNDRRIARLAVLYVEGTSEDPEIGHEGFLELVTDSAEAVQDFPFGTPAFQIYRFLNDWY